LAVVKVEVVAAKREVAVVKVDVEAARRKRCN
jgi:hypothetical protein